MRLSTAWPQFEADKRLLGYSPYTLKAYKLQSRLLAEFLEDPEIEEVKTEDLKGYLISLTHLKPASIGHRIRFIKSIFRWAQDEGIITGNPATKLREPKQGQRLPKALSEEVVEMLREACEGAFEHSLVELIYTTGCRIGEIYQLNRGDLNFNQRSVVVRGKGDKDREVYFHYRASIWLQKYLESRTDDDIALFVTRRKFGNESEPRRMSIAQLRYVIKRIAERADVDVNVYPHKFRHSYACHLLNNGAPMEAVSSLMGHSKIETTRIYAQLSGERRREMYQKYF